MTKDVMKALREKLNAIQTKLTNIQNIDNFVCGFDPSKRASWEL